jgi:hypothetical protein
MSFSVGVNTHCVVIPGCPKEIEGAVKVASLDQRMRMMFRQVLAYIFLLLLLVYVCTANQDTDAFRQNEDLRSRFLAKLEVKFPCSR